MRRDLSKVQLVVCDFDDTLAVHSRVEDWWDPNYYESYWRDENSLVNNFNIHPNRCVRQFLTNELSSKRKLCITWAYDSTALLPRKRFLDVYFKGMFSDVICVGSRLMKLDVIKRIAKVDNIELNSILVIDDCVEVLEEAHRIGCLTMTPQEIMNDRFEDKSGMRLDKKVIVLSGEATSGKTTFCNAMNKRYKTMVYEIVEPVKEVALQLGWDGVKDEKGRKLLSDIKMALTEYDNIPVKNILSKYSEFVESDYELLIIQMREPEEIKIVKRIPNTITVFIGNPNVAKITSNIGDASVNSEGFDYCINNDSTLEDFESLIDVFASTLSEE
ncbi:MAG: hypothetical protein IKL53_08290 [Lachnospiraceae bacterium]|nr:hypothetical protein [Lachnospiraceae bacterium]